MSHATRSRTLPAKGRQAARRGATSGLAMMAAVLTVFTPGAGLAQSAGTGGAAGGVGATDSGLSGSSVSGGTTITSPPPVSPTLGTTSGSDVGTSSGIGGTTGSGMGAGTTSGTGTGISTSAPTTSGALSKETTATQGDSTINGVTADSIARSDDPGAAATSARGSGGATTGMQTTEGGLAGSGSPEDYDIRTPRIGVDLESIRGALSADPSATPKANGD